MTDEEYFAHELRKAGTCESYRLKITGDDGESRWLSITPEQFENIRSLLVSPASGDVLTVAWNDERRSYTMHARAAGNDPCWASYDFPESDVDEMLSLGRDIVTGG